MIKVPTEKEIQFDATSIFVAAGLQGAASEGGGDDKTEVNLDEPWLVADRPDTFDDIVGHEHIIMMLRGVVESFRKAPDIEPPHLLLGGPPGTGKTTVGSAYARAAAWPPENVIEVNASEDRSVAVVRSMFERAERARMTHTAASARLHELREPRFAFLFDEVDSMMPGAQRLLAKMLDRNAAAVIATCNRPDKVVPELRSRTIWIPMDRLDDKTLKDIAKRSTRLHRVRTEKGVLDRVVDAANGDAREVLKPLDLMAGISGGARAKGSGPEPEPEPAAGGAGAPGTTSGWTTITHEAANVHLPVACDDKVRDVFLRPGELDAKLAAVRGLAESGETPDDTFARLYRLVFALRPPAAAMKCRCAGGFGKTQHAQLIEMVSFTGERKLTLLQMYGLCARIHAFLWP